MKRLLLKLAIAVTVGGLLYSIPAATQASPSTTKAARVQITKGPEIERAGAHPDFSIIRWTTNNPGGSPVHYGIVRYGTDPKKLDQTAKSSIRVNPSHSDTVFRVRMESLEPQTTYYYTVDSMESNGTGDGVKSPVKQFTTPSSASSELVHPPQH